MIEVLKSDWITTGPKTKLFEEKIAAYCHTEKVACLHSATACMELVLRLFGIGEGDEVITTAYTYTASASVVCHVGAKLVLVDVAPDSYQMDYEKLAAAITEKTKAIIAVDLAGVMCDYDKIFQIVSAKQQLFSPKTEYQKALGRVLVLADAAHSFGASYKGVVSGAVADFTSFSFHAVKNLTTAEGGAVTWRSLPGVDSDEIYRQFMLLSFHGQTREALAKNQPGDWEYDIVSPAYKCNMTDISAALGLGQLERYPSLLEKRKRLIALYAAHLPQNAVHMIAHETDMQSSSGHLLLVRLKGKNSEERNRFITAMADLGVSCNVHYKPLPMHTAYKNLGFDIRNFPNAYSVFENEVTLPLHSQMTEEDVIYVSECVRKVLK